MNSPSRWLSIKDAAVYLDVGEQTLYRWMRENKITYRKIGDSIRFLQEDLDVVVQIHPSQKDAAKVQEICPLCHHPELVEGVVQGTGRVYFRPKKTKFWTFRVADIPTQARMCPHCGGIFWFGAAEKLESLRHATSPKELEDKNQDGPRPSEE